MSGRRCSWAAERHLGGEVFLSWQQVAHVSGPDILLPPHVTSSERAFLCGVICCHVLSHGCVCVCVSVRPVAVS